MAWVTLAYTSSAPCSIKKLAACVKVPAVSISSSKMIAVLPLASPMRFIMLVLLPSRERRCGLARMSSSDWQYAERTISAWGLIRSIRSSTRRSSASSWRSVLFTTARSQASTWETTLGSMSASFMKLAGSITFTMTDAVAVSV